MENKLSNLSALFGDQIICLRSQINMNYYCGPISTAKLLVSSDKWEVSIINMNISVDIFFFEIKIQRKKI